MRNVGEELLRRLAARSGQCLDQLHRGLLPLRQKTPEEFAGQLVAERVHEDFHRRFIERQVVVRERREARACVAEERIRLHPVTGNGQQRSGRADAGECAGDAVEQLLHLIARVHRIAAQECRLDLGEPERQQLHSSVGADLSDGDRRLLDDVDVLSARGGVRERFELPIETIVRLALDAMEQEDQVAKVIRVDVGASELGLELVKGHVATERAVRFDEGEQRASLLRTLLAAQLAEQHVEV